ncbi:MAG: hypothetical protein IJS49_02955 [Paludibacteraceae bacterium]|nr:hypothetical protein [Paludibacteraceae bacterium]
MEIISKLTNHFNHGRDLEMARVKYEEKVESVNKNIEHLNELSKQLYDLRKASLRQLQALDSYVGRLANCPITIKKGTKRALEYADVIREAWDFENTTHQVNGQTGNAADVAMMGATMVGGAAAVGGPAAAMAIATTFGTASTGVAISSLGGAAAANAALAWLGGGAVAAGGAGIAGGTALLGLLGPIGWGIAGASGVALIVKSSFAKRKNDEAIKEINKYSENCDKMLKRIKMAIEKIQLVEKHTKFALGVIDLDYWGIVSLDYNAESYPQALLFEIVSEAKNLGKLMSQSVNINE